MNFWKRFSDPREKLTLWPVATRLKPRPVPTVDICEAPLVCLSLNAEWAGHVSGALSSLAERDMWTGTEADIDRAVQAIEGVCLMLGLPCQDGSSDFLMQFLIDTLMNTLGAGYDGTPGSIEPNAPADTFDSDATDTPEEAIHRTSSLCVAASMFVRYAVELEKQRRAGVTSITGLTAALPGLAALLFASTPIGFLGAALGTLAINIFNALFTAVTDAILNDETAIQDNICCLYHNLRGKSPTFANFQTGLDACSPPLTGNSEILRFALAFLLHEHDVFLSFLETLGKVNRLLEMGAVMECECVNWCYVFDFTQDDHGFTKIYPGMTRDTEGWHSVDVLDPPIVGDFIRVASIMRTMASRTVTKIAVEYDYIQGTNVDCDLPFYGLQFFHQTGDLFNLDFGSLPQGYRKWYTWTGNAPNRTLLGVTLRSSCKDAAPSAFSGYIRIRKLHWEGCGTNQFGVDNCAPPDPCP